MHAQCHYRGNNMIRTQILIEENQINWLRDRAREKGVSVSQLIREGVEFYRKYKDRLPEDQKKKALAAIGRYASGVSEQGFEILNEDAFR